jgi:hypothetical protein
VNKKILVIGSSNIDLILKFRPWRDVPQGREAGPLASVSEAISLGQIHER